MVKRLFFITLAVLVMASTASATEIGGVDLPDTLTAGTDKLILNGAGIRVKFFMDMYVGGLYLMQENKEAQKIIDANETMALKLHIVSGMVTTKKMKDAIDEGFINSIGENVASFQNEIKTFISFFEEEIKKNDIFDITSVPSEGISVYKNKSLKGTIKGLDFKKAVFGIWLGEKPADKKLKKGMLGK